MTSDCLHHQVAELTVDFWASIQDTPLAQRHPQLGVPLYRELQMRVLAKCTLPQSFTSWEDEVREEGH